VSLVINFLDTREAQKDNEKLASPAQKITCNLLPLVLERSLPHKVGKFSCILYEDYAVRGHRNAELS